MSSPHDVRTLVVGAGPAGTGVLVAAARMGALDALTDGGLCLLDPATEPGSLGRYGIASSTLAPVFLECLNTPNPPIAELRHAPASLALCRRGDANAPLPEVARYLRMLTRSLCDHLAGRPSFRTEKTALRTLQRRADGGYLARLSDGRTLSAERVVLATGGTQRLHDAQNAHLADGLTLGRWAARVVGSDRLLRPSAKGFLRRRLGGPSPRVVILGGSHSAFAVALELLALDPAVTFGAGAITLLHRQPFRVFYPSVAAAHADGYTGFDDDDVCPLTARVHRLGGLRCEARALCREVLGLDRARTEDRIGALDLRAIPRGALLERLDRADLIVAATGYRRREVPLFDAEGEGVAVGVRGAWVDDGCRVLDAHGAPLPDLYAVGLATGFRPPGEPGFHGMASGVWLFQHTVGERVCAALLGGAS